MVILEVMLYILCGSLLVWCVIKPYQEFAYVIIMSVNYRHLFVEKHFCLSI